MDPRFIGLSPAFEHLIVEMAQRFAAVSRAREGRAFHLRATTLSGWLEGVTPLDLEPHGFFHPGRRLPIILRHANGISDDDAAPDNRGATLRILDETAPAELDRPLLDLLLTTGTRFPRGNAEDFARWLSATPAEREAIVRTCPEAGTAAWEMLRTADSYTRLHYYTKVASHFVDRTGHRWFARYRLLPPDLPPESGFVDAEGRLLPPERVARDPRDPRPADFLHAELRDRIARGGIEYLLQVQLHSVPADPAEREAVLDCTRLWPEDVSPFRAVARLRLDGIVAPERIEPLRFNPVHAPAELAMVLAGSPSESASLNHLRSIVYDLSASVRTKTPLPPPLQALVERVQERRLPRPAQAPQSRSQRVCVVGGGASGLYAARALERLGHSVTVLERDLAVGGKCATMEIEGRRYDWGGHLCSESYPVLSALVTELGLEVEPVTPPVIYDLDTRHAADPPQETSTLRACLARYLRMRAAGFPEVRTPGLRRIASALAAPAWEWLRINRLQELGEAIAVAYTASGYGFLQDPELAAVYVIKMIETAGFDSAGSASRFWTVKGGFGRLWERVAEQLRDVRCGTYPVSVVRRSTGVRVTTNRGELEVDWLMVATPLPQALGFLDSTPEERDLFGRVRTLDYYTTVCVAHGLPECGFFLVKQRCSDRELVGHPVAFHHRYPGSNVYLFYSYGGPGLDREAIVQGIKEDVARMGGRVADVLDQRRWSYFPHFRSQDVADGRNEQLEQLQGRNRTYFLGSLFNFELIECNMAYAQDLVARAFGAMATNAPAPGALSSERESFAVGTPEDRLRRAEQLTRRLQQLVRDVVSLAELPGPDAGFVDFGMDSVRAMDMAQQLEGILGHELSPTVFFDYPTIRDLATYLAEPKEALSVSGPSTDPWVRQTRLPVRIQAGRDDTPSLFLINPVGGHASLYRDLAQELGRELSVYGFAAPAEREVSAGSYTVEGLAKLYIGELRAVQPAGPYLLGGASFGGMVAFEMAQQLRAQGQGVRVLVMMDTFGPGHIAGQFQDNTAVIVSLCRSLLSELRLHEDELRTLEPDTESQTALVRKRARAAGLLNALPPDFGVALVERMHRDLRAMADYVPRSYPGRILYYRAGEAADDPALREPEKVWIPLAEGGVELLVVSGNHMNMCNAPHVKGMARHLRGYLVPDDGRAISDEAQAERLASRWLPPRHGLIGAVAEYSLCVRARAASLDQPTSPRFPRALALMRSMQRIDGGVGDYSRHAYPNLVVALAFANTLIRWAAWAGTGSEEEISRAIAFGVQEALRLLGPPFRGNDGSFRASDSSLYGGWSLLAHECEVLFAGSEGRLSQAQRDTLQEILVRSGAGYDRTERPGTALFMIGVEPTASAATLRAIERMLSAEEDEPLPFLAAEFCFSLLYLAKGGVDVKRSFGRQIEYLRSQLRPDGLSATESTNRPDCDMTAIAQTVLHVLGFPTVAPTDSLERFWSEEHQCYQAIDGSYLFSPCVMLHVLDAYLTDPDMPQEHKQVVWRRVLAALRGRDWDSHHHLSPLYVLEKVISILAVHGASSPEDVTELYADAIDAVSKLQDHATGGFHSAWTAEPNEEETALALIALKNALASPLLQQRRSELSELAQRARTFLVERLARPSGSGSDRYPALWKVRLLYAPLNVIRSIVVAALAEPQ